MAILIKGRTKKEVAEDLRRAARDIERNAEDIVGEIEGVRSIKVLITMEPGALLQYKTFKEKMVSSMTEDIVKGVEEIRQHEAGEIKLRVDEIEDFGLHSSSFAIDTPEDAERLVDVTTDEAVQRAIEWAEQERKNNFRYMNFGDADSAAIAIQALRQFQQPTDEAVRVAIDWQEAEKESAQNAWERAGAEWRMEHGAQEQHNERIASFDLAIQALRQMKPSEWIPVSEKPKEGQEVLFTCICDMHVSDVFGMYKGYYEDGIF